MRNRRTIFRMLGILCFALALVITVFFLKEDREAQKESAKLLEQFQEEIEQTTETSTKEETEHILAVLEIPKLKRSLPVWNTYSEEQLKKTVCRYGEESVKQDQMIIAGHSYKSHFSKLGTLEKGDRISLYYADQKEENYVVSEVTQIDGNDVEGLFSGEWNLTLFTCNFGGEQRVVIRCTFVSK